MFLILEKSEVCDLIKNILKKEFILIKETSYYLYTFRNYLTNFFVLLRRQIYVLDAFWFLIKSLNEELLWQAKRYAIISHLLYKYHAPVFVPSYKYTVEQLLFQIDSINYIHINAQYEDIFIYKNPFKCIFQFVRFKHNVLFKWYEYLKKENICTLDAVLIYCFVSYLIVFDLQDSTESFGQVKTMVLCLFKPLTWFW